MRGTCVSPAEDGASRRRGVDNASAIGRVCLLLTSPQSKLELQMERRTHLSRRREAVNNSGGTVPDPTGKPKS